MTWFQQIKTPTDHIEYDVTLQVFAQQDGVCERVRVCVCACAVEIKPGTLRVSLVYACRRKYCLTYTEQDGNFPSKNGVIQYGLYTVSC